jgi:histidine triad (HIT) family protein
MATLFTRIIDGEIPGRFVWQDDQAVAFLTVAPINPGHVLVVPRAEVDHWIDLDDDLAGHLMVVARKVGSGVMAAYQPRRVALMIAGLEVPHCHLHLVPIATEAELTFARADHDARPEDLDTAAEKLRSALRDEGFGSYVPEA